MGLGNEGPAQCTHSSRYCTAHGLQSKRRCRHSIAESLGSTALRRIRAMAISSFISSSRLELPSTVYVRFVLLILDARVPSASLKRVVALCPHYATMVVSASPEQNWDRHSTRLLVSPSAALGDLWTNDTRYRSCRSLAVGTHLLG